MQRHMANLHLDDLKISHFILFCFEFQGARSKGRWKESLLSVPNFVADA